jgi:hypothetical protein
MASPIFIDSSSLKMVMARAKLFITHGDRSMHYWSKFVRLVNSMASLSARKETLAKASSRS